MLSDEEREEYEELKSLLYTGTISQYGKRKLIDMFEKQQKEIEELKVQNNKLAQCHFRYEEMTGIDLLLPDKLEYTSNDKIKEMLNGYKKALKDVEEAIAILKTNLLIVADEKNKKEIDKELKFREEDKISKIAIINLLEDLLKEE